MPKTKLEVVGQYIILGFEHILPKGLDHILFVLGLFLLSTRLRPVLLQVTAFTNPPQAPGAFHPDKEEG